MSYPKILEELLQDGPVSLASWFAEPMTAEQAAQLMPDIRRRLSAQRADSGSGFRLRLAELIMRYWDGQDIEAGHQNLFALLAGKREKAILELAFGQLLLARRHAHAWEHLEHGFSLATHLLEAEEYFTVLKRHELLRQLPLGQVPVEAAPLDALLEESRVIARLTGRGPRSRDTAAKHGDTLD